MRKRIALPLFGSLAFLIIPYGAPAAFPRTAGSAFTITTRVYNQSAATRRDITEMEAVTRKIFARSGIETVWLECLAPSGQPSAAPECQQPYDSNTIFLALVNHSGRIDPRVLGWSALGTARATVFYQRAKAAARESLGNPSASQILAYAAAHEIAHLMLGSGEHSIAGLMKETWSHDEFINMAADDLFFTAQESRSLRRGS